MNEDWHKLQIYLIKEGLVTFRLLSALLIFSCTTNQPAEAPVEGLPLVLDSRLELSLFAEDPYIVTPVGIAIDKNNRIFVLESHTHLPPQDYQGPKGDVIKMFLDKGNGKPEISVFADGFKEGLNMSFSPEGHLYLVTSKEVWVLYDRDGDGVCEEKEIVLELVEPESVYAHAALLGITFSDDGWMYVSRGNTGSAKWKMEGRDGSFLEGYGDGGNIMRARPDGTKLEEVSTGYWNPIDLKFDDAGHLLVADNDPDSRGPNRLVHSVKGGDFGYKSLYGGSGIHPYLAWNGELAGTLPYAVELGEAPSGLINASHTSLPLDYKGNMLCTIWEESRVVRIKLAPNGVSVTGETEIIVEGDDEFRPVAFAADNEGNIYITDWVLRYYPNHGKGKIWKLSTREDVERLTPDSLFSRQKTSGGTLALNEIFNSDKPEDFEKLRAALLSDDPFIVYAASETLARPVFSAKIKDATRDPEAKVRLGALVALHRSANKDTEPIAHRLLSDPDPAVRQRTLMWIGSEGMASLRPHLEKALEKGPVSAPLFETYLETVKHLEPKFIIDYESKAKPYARALERKLPDGFIENLVSNPATHTDIRANAIKYLEKPAENVALLLSMLSPKNEEKLQLEIIRTLAGIPRIEVGNQLLKVVQESTYPANLRAEALLALSRQPIDASAEAILLLEDSIKDLQVEAARYLRTQVNKAGVKDALKQKYGSISEKDDPIKELIALALSPDDLDGATPERPGSFEEWLQVLDASEGSRLRGQRVFFSVQSLCYSCHAVQGRGGDLGPDLSNIGKSKTREQILHSLIFPSEEINPEWQGWFIKLKNGRTIQGRQIDVKDNSIELYTQADGFVSFPKADIERYGMAEKSLMPDGLEKQLTPHDVRDLVKFLESK